jgi:hypothetical protein
METHYINCGIHYNRTHADSSYSPPHGLTNYIDTKAQCRRLKTLTCKGTSWQVFIIIYMLKIHSVMLVF